MDMLCLLHMLHLLLVGHVLAGLDRDRRSVAEHRVRQLQVVGRNDAVAGGHAALPPPPLHVHDQPRLVLLLLLLLEAVEERVGGLPEDEVAALTGGLLLLGGRGAGRAVLPVRVEPRGRDVRLLAGSTHVGALVIVQTSVQFKMHILCKPCRAFLAWVRLLAQVEPIVRL